MDINMSFKMDSEVKAKMVEICEKLGITTSTAFNVFAQAFVQANGMPVVVELPKQVQTMSKEQILADTNQTLSAFVTDYEKMAK